MGDPIRIGVIGVGMIGKAHLREYAKIPDAKIVAVSDVNEAEAKRVADEFKVPQVFSDFRKMLALKEIDAVDVCLHNNFHAPMSIAAMEAGKQVYCEKPMSGSYADSKAMFDAAKKLGHKLHIQLGTLYSPEHKIARRLIEEGHLGKVYHARSFGFRRRGRPFVDGYGTPAFVQKEVAAGGALFDMGIYHIAQVLHLLGNPQIETISGATHQEIPMYEDRRKSSNYSVEEFALGFVRMQGGITLDLEESWAVHYDDTESSKILGSKGGLKLRPLTFFSAVGDMEYAAQMSNQIDNRWRSCDVNYSAYDGSQQHWIAVLQGKVPLLETAAVALNVSLISEGIYLCQQKQREVTSAEVADASKSTAIKV
ncbi:MAG: Gfo/Idh/MocA family oxidoreductase [Planctomycetes bacterium]|nr:Gfo/Idh/MocA family oxidoreductase [Planctomycetota bacterium]